MMDLETMSIFADDALIKQLQLEEALADIKLWRQKIEENDAVAITSREISDEKTKH
tara:strand:- start:419 stop:586 length:168 start_codon:yes stop_codon:yes gene_type:complete